MKKTIYFVVVLCAGLAFYPGCKKAKSSVASPLADSLRKYCTAPFVGLSDSSNLYLPTAFTPNGDGINDYFGFTFGNIGTFSSFQLSIYDTTGILVFQTNAASRFLWEGTDMATGQQSKKYKFYVKINYVTTGNIADSGYTFLYLVPTSSGGKCINAVISDTSKYEFVDEFLPGTGFACHCTNEQYCN